MSHKPRHAWILAGFLLFTPLLLGILVNRSEIFFADGLRYIDQARRIAAGSWREALFHSIDHPAYPIVIALVHGIVGDSGPEGWRFAAQGASALAATLLVIPLYLSCLEIFGARSAWLGCLIFMLLPRNNHVFADALSESTFLLFWTWGLWSALRFLREGKPVWLPVALVFGALAYFVRPEGLLLPIAILATLLVIPLLKSTRLHRARWWSAIALFVVGGVCLIGPYVIRKGGLGTKPAIARILGTSARSGASAVERDRPLDPNQTELQTAYLAVKAVARAMSDAVGLPLLALALVGAAAAVRAEGVSRTLVFLSIIMVASWLALMRLHMTGGYCTPRHALIPAMIAIFAAARGITSLIDSIRIPLAGPDGRESAALGPAAYVLVVAALVAWLAPAIARPINEGAGGYRDAGKWTAEHAAGGDAIVDVTGWSLYYANKPGYTFANIGQAPDDPRLRWVIVREQHLAGPWEYCRILRGLTQGLEPIAAFPKTPRPRASRVLVFDRAAALRDGAPRARVALETGRGSQAKP